MANDQPDNPGILVPPPLIYVLPLLARLALDRRVHVGVLPRGVAHIIGWPIVGGAVALLGWSFQTLRSADTLDTVGWTGTQAPSSGEDGENSGPS